MIHMNACDKLMIGVYAMSLHDYISDSSFYRLVKIQKILK